MTKRLENPSQIYPMIVTTKLSETKEFYLRAGFRVRHELRSQYLQVYYGQGEGLDLSFMAPQELNAGKPLSVFGGEGLVMSVPTPNADEKCAELRKLGVEIDGELEDKPWGWRSFHVSDPNGVVLDFFHVYKAVPPPV